MVGGRVYWHCAAGSSSHALMQHACHVAVFVLRFLLHSLTRNLACPLVGRGRNQDHIEDLVQLAQSAMPSCSTPAGAHSPSV